MYYRCLECGAVMDEIESLTVEMERHDELPERPVEYISYRQCIYCGSYEIEEV